MTSILSAISLPQFLAIGLSFFFAVLVHRAVREGIRKLATTVEAPVWDRLFRTARLISLPIAWVIGLWLSLLILGGVGQITGLVRLVASLLNAWVVIRIAATVIPNTSAANIFSWTAWGLAALNAVGQLDTLIRWMARQRIESSTVNISLWDTVQGLVITIMMLWLALTTTKVMQHRLEKAAALNPSMRVLVIKLMRIMLVIVALVVGMRSMGIDLTALAFFSGALGIGVGLGMQRTVGNLVAGFTMLADRSIKPGDVIEITTGDGPTYGEVKTLGARYVSVRTRAGTETLIPNEILIASPVTNWSFTDRLVRRDLMIGVSYNADIERAQALCIEGALKCDRVEKDPAPACLIKGFGDSSVDMELRFWISDPEFGVSNVGSDVFVQIWKLFHEHGIEIPFPQRDIHIKST